MGVNRYTKQRVLFFDLVNLVSSAERLNRSFHLKASHSLSHACACLLNMYYCRSVANALISKFTPTSQPNF